MGSGGPIIWTLRAVPGTDIALLQAGYTVKLKLKSGVLQPPLMRQRPQQFSGQIAPDVPVNLPWNAVGMPSLLDVPRAYPRPVHALLPKPPTYFTIAGVTRDSTGTPLGNCIVDWFDTATDTKLDTVTSDANGLFEFRNAGRPPNAYYLVAYKAGLPDVAGTTVNTLVGQ